ncbi:hypothetical protein HNY73_003506 [Argiope bruennichi]|uniref:Uncharacterized protein n=1 Tax=Argiope bruennichi TaxID=94029 RepID=A0A8T0FNA7_ARGBR|nr:hypothetical protein HNY73_003506 [Argiope bruennichi]
MFSTLFSGESTYIRLKQLPVSFPPCSYLEIQCTEKMIAYNRLMNQEDKRNSPGQKFAIVYAQFVIQISCGFFSCFGECNSQRKRKQPWVEGARDSWVAVADVDHVDSAVASCLLSKSQHQLD